MKYVVINCIEREILKVGEADTPKEATEIMKSDFMNEFSNNFRFSGDEEAESAFHNGYGRNDAWDCSETEAWLNGRDCSYDWRIITVGN